jgi:hypothetical protein
MEPSPDRHITQMVIDDVGQILPLPIVGTPRVRASRSCRDSYQ